MNTIDRRLAPFPSTTATPVAVPARKRLRALTANADGPGALRSSRLSDVPQARTGAQRIGRYTIDDVGLPAEAKRAMQAFIAELPADVSYGWVGAPVNPARPSGPQMLTFFYARLVPGQTPVFFVNGGPAGASEGFFGALGQGFLKDLSYVFTDQPGTGGSTPFPVSLAALSPERMALMRWFASRGTVTGIDEVRRFLLGADGTIRVLAHSYGGIIAMRLLEQPIHEHIAALYVHAGLLPFEPSPGDVMLGRVRAQITNWHALVARYPDDAGKPERILAALRAHPEVIDAARTELAKTNADVMALRFDATAIVASIAYAMGSSLDAAHDYLASLTPGPDGVVPVQALVELVRTYVLGVYELRLAAREAIVRLEITPGLSRRDGIALAMQRLHATPPLVNEANVYPNIGSADGALEAALPMLAPDPIDIATVNANLKASPHLEVTLYAYPEDSIVPPALVHSLAQQLGSRVRYSECAAGGHNGVFTNSAARKDLDS